MIPRTHAVLDGELPRPLLRADEQAELEALEASAAAAAAWASALPVPSFADRVLRALPEPAAAPARSAAPREWLRAAARWLWTPRQLVIRPAALVPAFALVAALVLGGAPATGPAPDPAVAAAPATAVYVEFRLDAPGAQRVAVAGSFTGWKPEHGMRESAPGVWTVRVPLAPGIHDYAFVVDGERWVPDPAALPVDDGFGGSNSRLYLTLPAAS